MLMVPMTLPFMISGCDCGGETVESGDAGAGGDVWPADSGGFSDDTGRDDGNAPDGGVDGGGDAGGDTETDAGAADGGTPCTAGSAGGRWLFTLTEWSDDPQGCSGTTDHTGEDVWVDIQVQGADALVWAYFPESISQPPYKGTVVQNGYEIDGASGDVCKGYSWWIVLDNFCNLTGMFGEGSGGPPPGCCQRTAHFTGERQQ
ncbi:MAG: hypothetical protein HY897_00110 [Deltaproteobacteria bacterium]|nr:hypothetical protein [Deltaproteobacteria bacterium]